MKDVYQVFDEYFLILHEVINQSNFSASTIISTDLIKFSEMIGYDDGVFIGEVFESTFGQIGREIGEFVVSEPDSTNTIKIFTENIKIISKCYRDSDKNGLYNALRDMRVNATKLQYYMRRQCKRKPQGPQFQLPFQLR